MDHYAIKQIVVFLHATIILNAAFCRKMLFTKKSIDKLINFGKLIIIKTRTSVRNTSTSQRKERHHAEFVEPGTIEIGLP